MVPAQLNDSWFSVGASCGPGDYPQSDVLNLASIAAVGNAAFSNYEQEKVSVTFKDSTAAQSGAAADADWAMFVPPNNGFFQATIQNYTVMLGISTFHAMHCLDSIRRVIEVQYGVASNETVAKNKNSEFTSFAHLQHCLIYLRQGVMCNADPTLEHHINFGNGTEIRGGNGTVHTCRNFQALYDMSANSDNCMPPNSSDTQ